MANDGPTVGARSIIREFVACLHAAWKLFYTHALMQMNKVIRHDDDDDECVPPGQRYANDGFNLHTLVSECTQTARFRL